MAKKKQKDIEIVRPSVFLKIGKEQLKLEHSEIEKLHYVLGQYLGLSSYRHNYGSVYSSFVNAATTLYNGQNNCGTLTSASTIPADSVPVSSTAISLTPA